MVKQVNIKKNLMEIQQVSGATTEELTTFFNKILLFLDKHTSCDGQRAIQVALYETSHHFIGTC